MLICDAQETADPNTTSEATDEELGTADSPATSSEETSEAEPKATSPEIVSPSTAEDFFQRALEHEKKNELDEAIADCTEAIRLDPENLEYLIWRAEMYLESRNFDKGFEDSAKILDTDANNLRARVLRGKMFELSGHTDRALTEFNAVVEQNPTSWEALFERQRYFQRQGQYDQAMADGDRMTQLQPDSPAGYLSRAMTHALSGEFDQALNYSSAAIQQDPENWAAYNLRGTSRTVNGEFAEAMSDFDTALKLSPDNASVYSARATLYHIRGEYEKAIADREKAARLKPDGYGFKAGLADLLATCPDNNLRNGKKASEYAAEALRLAPNDPDVWRAAAAAAAENGNFEDAIKWQERLLGSNVIMFDQKPESQERLAAYKAHKPYREILPPIDELLAQKKIKRANEATRNGNFDRAIALSSEVIATDAKNIQAHSQRGLAYYKQQKYDLAIADFSTVIGINTKDADAYFYRAHSFEKTRRYNKALDDLLMVEKLDPESGTGMGNSLAWFFATCPDDKIRDGARAAEYVDRALELRPNERAIWDTRAAVFAENGDFDDAIKWEKRYLEAKDLSESDRKGGEARLALYQAHKPYRQEVEEPTKVSESTSSATPGQPEK